MNPSFARLFSCCIATLVASTPVASAFAAGAVAKIVHQPTVLTFLPSIEYESASLRVVGPDGFVHDREFGSGTPVFASAVPLADGRYTYELVFGRKRVDAAKAAGGLRRGDAAAVDTALQEQAEKRRASASGSFLVEGGRIVPLDRVEESPPVAAVARAKAGSQAPIAIAPKDIVNADDLIVQGSVCAGLDCVENESFGFDTLRLKENNTRIKFMDTSASAGFANFSWQLTANDSASGGANKFSIEDVTSATVPFTVTGAAPTDSLFIASNGKVGLRTATPLLDLHLRTSDSPAIRLEQTNAGGFTAQTWDVAGNEAHFFVRDLTAGSRLPLRIRPGAPTSSLDIASSGSVGIGTASPNISGLPRAVTIATPNAGSGPSEIAGLELAGAQTSVDTAFGVVRFFNQNVLRAQVAGARQGADDASSLRFITSEAGVLNERMRIMPSGKVGIGTTTPVSRLHVQGDAYITGNLHVLGTCCGPDYVFDPSYKLASIDEQAEYMRANRHLPAVGPARTTEDGHAIVNVFAQSNGILEELEKAHLYIETLHREIQALKAQAAQRDARLREEMAELKRLVVK